MTSRAQSVKAWSDPLLRAIIGVAVALAVGLVALYFFGSAGGILFAIPGIVQAIVLVLATEAVAIAFFAFSRYRVLPEPMPFWIGIAMTAYAIGELFVLLGFPYTPEGAAVIAQLPNTGSWLGYANNALFAIFLLAAALASRPRSRRMAEWWWLLVVVVTVIVVAAIQTTLVVFERNLPLIVTEGVETSLRDYLYVPLAIMSGIGAVLFARRYRQAGDVLAGYASLGELLLAAEYVALIISAARFDFAYYVVLAFLFSGPTVLLFGLLSEYVSLIRREQEKSRELEVLREEAERRAEDSRQRAAEARQRAAELDVANKELEAFSFSVSHDLRAPLRRIDSFSQILLQAYGDKLDEQGKQYLQLLRQGSEKMDALIDALLKLSRVTRAEMRRQPVNLSELAESLLAELHKEQPERGLESTIAPGVVVNGDPQLLRIVLENLLRNAWKFTSKRPVARIEFGVTRQDHETVYSVKDNGAGFDMAYADKLFGAFQRLHKAEEFPGTGIGLATVQRIIHRHGGRVWAEGEVDKGATFYFTLG